LARQRKPPPPQDKDESFNVLFISLNLILLSFFILLNSMATRDSERTRKALGSLLGTFGILEGGHSMSREGDSVLPSDPMVIRAKKAKMLEDELQQMLRQIKDTAGRQQVKVVHTADGLELEFTDTILFSPDGVEVNPEVFGLLDRIARLMKLTGKSVTVQGFSDPRPPASYPSNFELSGSRAVRVARYLVEAAGMDRGRVVAEGHGARTREVAHRRFVKILVPAASMGRALEGK